LKNLRQKVIQGLAWSLANVLSNQALSLIIHIFLARLLLPECFGLLGMISIFTGLALRIQGAGLGESLLRKKEVSVQEYNFVFCYGLCVGALFYLIFFFSAPAISRFYNEPQLILIIRVMTLNLMLIPLRGINRIQLVKRLNFKSIALIETLTLMGSGAIGIILAWAGFGVWSLVANFIGQHAISLLLFFSFNRWIPSTSIDIKASKALFAIGWKLMVANFINVGFREIYNVIIGRQYSAQSLGFYLQGMKLQRLPSDAISAMIKNVSFPAFAQIKEDKPRYRHAFGNTIRLLTYINFTVLVGLAAIADPLIPFVFSEKWRATIPFFQVLVIIGLMEPVKSLFVNILKVEGEAGALIKYMLLGKTFYIIGILLASGSSIYALVISQIVSAFLELLLFSTIGRYISYTFLDFSKDIFPNLLVALPTGACLFWLNRTLNLPSFYLLTIDTLAGALIVIAISLITGNPSFTEIQREVLKRIRISST